MPFFLLGFYFLTGVDDGFWSSLAGLTFGGLGLTAAMFLVMVKFCRDLGKLIEEKIFTEGLTFPTTTFLSDDDDSLSDDYKAKVIQKINLRFGTDLSNKTTGSVQDKRAINEAVRSINSMFYGKNALLLQRTIQFGFSKNLFAGTLIAIVTSLIGILISILTDNSMALNAAVVLLVSYIIVGALAFLSIRFTAKHYAQALYSEFMASE